MKRAWTAAEVELGRYRKRKPGLVRPCMALKVEIYCTCRRGSEDRGALIMFLPFMYDSSVNAIKSL